MGVAPSDSLPNGDHLSGRRTALKINGAARTSELGQPRTDDGPILHTSVQLRTVTAVTYAGEGKIDMRLKARPQRAHPIGPAT